MEKGGRALLCSHPACNGARLSVEGFTGRPSSRPVLAIGIIDQQRLTLVQLPRRRASARF